MTDHDRCRCGAAVRTRRDNRGRPIVVETTPTPLVLPLAFHVPPPYFDGFSRAGDMVRGRRPLGDEHTVDVYVRHECQ
jgi:hypothetical protein